MANGDLERVALTLVAGGKGILAADETIPILTRRFDTLAVKSTEQSRRADRDMLFTSFGAAEFIPGVIIYHETISQSEFSGHDARGVSCRPGRPSWNQGVDGCQAAYRLSRRDRNSEA